MLIIPNVFIVHIPLVSSLQPRGGDALKNTFSSHANWFHFLFKSKKALNTHLPGNVISQTVFELNLNH